MNFYKGCVSMPFLNMVLLEGRHGSVKIDVDRMSDQTVTRALSRLGLDRLGTAAPARSEV